MFIYQVRQRFDLLRDPSQGQLHINQRPRKLLFVLMLVNYPCKYPYPGNDLGDTSILNNRINSNLYPAICLTFV